MHRKRSRNRVIKLIFLLEKKVRVSTDQGGNPTYMYFYAVYNFIMIMYHIWSLKTIKGKSKHPKKGKPVDLIYVSSVSKDDVL